MYFSVQLEPTGVTKEGVNAAGALFFFLLFLNDPLPPAVLASIFIARRVQPSLLSSTMASNLGSTMGSK